MLHNIPLQRLPACDVPRAHTRTSGCAHGPDLASTRRAMEAELKPQKLDNTLAFMFETRFRQNVTKHAAESALLQTDYPDCWSGLKKHFNPDKR